MIYRRLIIWTYKKYHWIYSNFKLRNLYRVNRRCCLSLGKSIEDNKTKIYSGIRRS